MHFKILGIEIERKTDILALAAFIISIGSLLSQVVLLLRGADITLYKPEQILIKSHEYPDGKSYMRLSATMTYRNSGSPGYNDTIRKEKVFFTINEKKYELNWDDYIDSTAKEKEIIITKKTDAVPTQVDAGSVVVHETYFAPWPAEGDDPSANYIEWNDFIEKISSQKSLLFKFHFESFDGKKEEVSCKVVVSEFIKHLKQKGWSAPTCNDTQQ